MSTDPPDQYAAAMEAAGKLGIPGDALADLLKGDHWSLVIKSAAIIEGAFNDLLAEELGRPVPSDVVRELGAKYTREWLVELDAIDRPTADMAEVIAGLRNKLAHGPQRVVAFSLAAYRAELDENQRKSFLRRLGFKEAGDGFSSLAKGDELWSSGDPRLIWAAMIAVLSFVNLRHRQRELEQSMAASDARRAAVAELVSVLDVVKVSLETHPKSKS